MKAATLSCALAVLCLGILPGCTTKQDLMEQQIQQHDAQLRRLQPVQADSVNQVQTLQQEVDELKGLVADLRKAGGASALVDKINRHDQALQQIETRMAMKFDLGAPLAASATTTAAATTATAAAAPSSATAPEPYTAGGPVTLSPASSQAAQAAPVAAAAGAAAAATPSGDTWGQETPRAKAPTAQKDMSVALYDAGVNAFKSRNYSSAQKSFSDYMKNYSSGSNAPSAQYYLAECYFQTNKFADAALEYDKVINKYPKSSRVPGAYLKQGICFSKIGSKSAARQRMQELIKKYPKSPEATRAKDFLKNNK